MSNILDPGGREVNMHWQTEHLGEVWLRELNISDLGIGPVEIIIFEIIHVIFHGLEVFICRRASIFLCLFRLLVLTQGFVWDVWKVEDSVLEEGAVYDAVLFALDVNVSVFP